MAKNHGPQIKDDERYEKLRQEGASKEKLPGLRIRPLPKPGTRAAKPPHTKR